MRREWTLSKLECDCSPSVHHKVEPTVLLGHRVALVVEVGVRHSDSDEATAGVGQDPSTNYSGTTIKMYFAKINFRNERDNVGAIFTFK